MTRSDAPLDTAGATATHEVRDWVVGIACFVAVGVGLGAIVWPLVAGAADDPVDGPLASLVLVLVLVVGVGLTVGSVGRRILQRGTGLRRVPGAVVVVALVVALAPYTRSP